MKKVIKQITICLCALLLVEQLSMASMIVYATEETSQIAFDETIEELDNTTFSDEIVEELDNTIVSDEIVEELNDTTVSVEIEDTNSPSQIPEEEEETSSIEEESSLEEETESGTEEETTQQETQCPLLEQKLESAANGIKVSVEGKLPEDTRLQVRAVALNARICEEVAEVSDLVDSVEEINDANNQVYSYDITLLYDGKEYEPDTFGESVKVQFSFDDPKELSDANAIEVLHVEDTNEVEKIDVEVISDSKLCFEADHFSTYIVIKNIAYNGEKEWQYGFTGNVERFYAPMDGVYVCNLYGAQGGHNGGKGTFVSTQIVLKKGDELYIHVGGTNGYNGGGTSNNATDATVWAKGYQGGGATDIRIYGDALSQRMLVAGGGAGYAIANEVGTGYKHRKEQGKWICDLTQIDDEFEGAFSGMPESNGQFGQGTQAEASTNIDAWSHDHGNEFPYAPGAHVSGEVNTGAAAGAGGGGYYGGTAGHAGTSFIDTTYQYNSAEVISYDINAGNGKVVIQLLEGKVKGAHYKNYDGTELAFYTADDTGMTAMYTNATPTRAADEKYEYIFDGWDVIGTPEKEKLDHQQAAQLLYQEYTVLMATYREVGRSYRILFDEENPTISGTKQVTVRFGEALPLITIPQKQDFIFEGYYTEPNANGTKLYQCDGTAVKDSIFTKNTTVYANWIDPLHIVENRTDKTLVSGYTGITLSQTATLDVQRGYTLQYQWYENTQNTMQTATVLAGETKSQCLVPHLAIGEHYIFCKVTAQNMLNEQSISKTTLVSKIQVKKAVFDTSYISAQTPQCVFDGEKHALKAQVQLEGNYEIYYAKEPINGTNYLQKGSKQPNSYEAAGTYKDYIYVVLDDFENIESTITMTIKKATPKIFLANKNVTYEKGKTQQIDEAVVYGIHDQILPQANVTYTYYTDAACTTQTDAKNGAKASGTAPEKVGTYYVKATVKESENYMQATTATPVMFNILGTRVAYSVTGYEGFYDGKRHEIKVDCEDDSRMTFYFSDEIKLTRENYLQKGRQQSYAYEKVGSYRVYYLAVTRLTNTLNTYENGYVDIIIHPVSTPTGDHNGTGGSTTTGGGNGAGDSQTSGGANDGGSNPSKPVTQVHKHVYGEYDFYLAPTYQSKGYATYPCLICGEKYRVDFAALHCDNHHFVEVERVEATTQKEGFVREQCLNCGETNMRTLPIRTGGEQTNHKVNIPTRQPQTENNHTMTDQDTTQFEQIEKTMEKTEDKQNACRHTYVLLEKRRPTQERDGYAIYSCRKCGYQFKKTLSRIGSSDLSKLDLGQRKDSGYGKNTLFWNLDYTKQDKQSLETDNPKTLRQKKEAMQQEEAPTLRSIFANLSDAERAHLIHVGINCVLVFFLLLLLLMIYCLYKSMTSDKKKAEKPVMRTQQL